MARFSKYALVSVMAMLASLPVTEADDRVPQELALPVGAVARYGASRFLNFGRVFSIAISPDGKLLAGGAWDGTIRVWDIATGKELHLFQEQRGPVHALAFSPDGSLLASAGKKSDLIVRNSVTGNEVRRLKGHEGMITSLAFSPDGKELASKASDRSVRVWDVALGREISKLGSPTDSKQANDSASPIGFSSDGKALISASLNLSGLPGSNPRTFHVWNASTGAEIRSFLDDSVWHGPAAISSEKKVLASFNGPARGHPPRISLWDLENGKSLPPIHLSQDGGMTLLSALAFSPDGRVLAASGGGPIRLWEMATRREMTQLATADNGAASLAFSPDGRTLASGSTDITALLWDLTGRMQNRVFQTARLSTEELQQSCNSLGDANAAKARQALWALVAAGDQSVTFLQERIHPAENTSSPAAITRLVNDLSNPEYAVRAEASARLVKLAELAEPALLEAQQKHPTLELRRRIDDLLKLIVGARVNPSGDQLRGWRAVQILEQINTPSSRKMLQTLAGGAAAAILTREAQASLARLERHTAAAR